MVLDKKKLLIAMSDSMMNIELLRQASGVSRNTISRVLNSDIKIRPQTAGKLAKALGVKVEDLL